MRRVKLKLTGANWLSNWRFHVGVSDEGMAGYGRFWPFSPDLGHGLLVVGAAIS